MTMVYAHSSIEVRGQNPTTITSAEDGILNMKVIDQIYSKAGLSVRGNQ